MYRLLWFVAALHIQNTSVANPTTIFRFVSSPRASSQPRVSWFLVWQIRRSSSTMETSLSQSRGQISIKEKQKATRWERIFQFRENILKEKLTRHAVEFFIEFIQLRRILILWFQLKKSHLKILIMRIDRKIFGFITNLWCDKTFIKAISTNWTEPS